MAGRKKASVFRFQVKFHVVMSSEMKNALKERAKRDNIPEGQVIRQLLAEEFGMSEEHVDSHIGYQNLSPTAHPVSSKRMFANVPHPLEAAMGRPVLSPKEEDDA